MVTWIEEEYNELHRLVGLHEKKNWKKISEGISEKILELSVKDGYMFWIRISTVDRSPWKKIISLWKSKHCVRRGVLLPGDGSLVLVELIEW